MLKLPKQFLDEISRFDKIYCLISGGWHSTAAALLLYEEGLTCVLVHNSTKLEIPSCRKTMQALVRFTGWEYIETDPILPEGQTVMDIMRDSIKMIPEVMEDIKNKKYDRSKFKCCHYLKKLPGRIMYKTIDRGNSVVISGMTPYESNNRRFRMKELRDQNIYLRYHKKNGGVFHAYPFRDCYRADVFDEYLKDRGWDVSHSGCIVCPILVCFDIYKGADNERYRRTAALVKKITPMELQTFIDEYS
jgi:hypothetical protein